MGRHQLIPKNVDFSVIYVEKISFIKIENIYIMIYPSGIFGGVEE